jgi:hypothetical protein
VPKLKTSVHVHEDDGTVVVYQAGDTVSAKHAKLISNPKVWADEPKQAKSEKPEA